MFYDSHLQCFKSTSVFSIGVHKKVLQLQFDYQMPEKFDDRTFLESSNQVVTHKFLYFKTKVYYLPAEPLT